MNTKNNASTPASGAHRYTIRPLGCTAWATTDSLAEAHRLRREAAQLLSGQEIVLVDGLAPDLGAPQYVRRAGGGWTQIGGAS